MERLLIRHRAVPRSREKVSKKEIEQEDIILVLEVISEHSLRDRYWFQEVQHKNKANTLEDGNNEKDKQINRPKGEEHFDHKQAAMLPSSNKQ